MTRRALVALFVGSALVSAAPAMAETGVYGPASMNRARAVQIARARLALVHAPAGAVLAGGEPAGDHRWLHAARFEPDRGEVADARAWWTIRASPAEAIRRFERGLPGRLQDSSGDRRPGGLADELDPVGSGSGVGFDHFEVAAVRIGPHTSGVLVAAVATWLRPRPAWDRVPVDDVRTVQITSRNLYDDARLDRPGVPLVLRGPTARMLAAFVNRMAAAQPGPVPPCAVETGPTNPPGAPPPPPQPFGESSLLRFRDAHRGALARVQSIDVACLPSARVTVGGRRGPTLEDGTNTTSLTDELRRLGVPL